jgi:segregation and condensation protein B
VVEAEEAAVTEAAEATDAVEAEAPEVVEAAEAVEAEALDTVEVVEAAEAPEADDAATEGVEADVPEAVEVVEGTEAVEAVEAVDAAEGADVLEVSEVAGEAAGPAQEVGVNIEHLRMAEALLFAASEPLSEDALKASMPEGADVSGIIVELQKIYESRGVTLARVAEKWQFRTAPDLAFLLRKEKPEQKRLSRAAIETLAIIAYHQPVTRAEIEDIRGVMLSKGTLDTLMEVGWIKIRGRKRTPGRPVTYGTTEAFLVQFGLENIGHLPGMDELKAAGFLEAIPPSGLDIPSPSDQLAPDEDPYDGEEVNDLATGGADPFIPGSSAE